MRPKIKLPSITWSTGTTVQLTVTAKKFWIWKFYHAFGSMLNEMIEVRQNFFNLASAGAEIRIIRHVRSVVPRLEGSFLYQKKASSVKQADLRDMFRKTSKSVCTSNRCGISWPPLSYSIRFFQLWRPQKTENDPDDPETSDKEKSKWNTPLVSFSAQV